VRHAGAAAAFGIDAFVRLLAVLTLQRVVDASTDDAVLVLGMNRIRAADVGLDPSAVRVQLARWTPIRPSGVDDAA
jgi:hypothetical protein